MGSAGFAGAACTGAGTSAGVGFGFKGCAGPVGDFKIDGRISTIALRGMPAFGSGPVNARSKRLVSRDACAGAALGSGRGRMSIFGCTGSIERGRANGVAASGRAVTVARGAAAASARLRMTGRFTRHARNAPRK